MDNSGSKEKTFEVRWTGEGIELVHGADPQWVPQVFYKYRSGVPPTSAAERLSELARFGRTLHIKGAPEEVLEVYRAAYAREFYRASLIGQRQTQRAGGEATAALGPVVPRKAEYILELLTPPKYRESALGDLEENFRKHYDKYGAIGAKVILYADVMRSALWFILRLILMFIGEWVRRYIS